MDQSRHQYSGFWFICKYCQRVFRDKLELFCHQVNEHPEYREELNGQRSGSGSHEMIYSDPRSTVDMKRHSNSFVQSAQQHSTSTPTWYPPSGGHIPNHVESTQSYYTNPVEYYVVVPNQNQNQSTSSATTSSNTGNPVMNIPVPLVNQQIAHASSSLASCQQQQQPQLLHQQQPNSHGTNLVTLRNEGGNEWSKVGGDSSDTDTCSSVLNKDDLDYYCWKCKVKFGNAATYIAHSSSCFPPNNQDLYANQSQSASESEFRSNPVDRVIHQTPRKRGRKPKGEQDQYDVEAKRRKPNPDYPLDGEEDVAASTTPSTTSSKGRRNKTFQTQQKQVGAIVEIPSSVINNNTSATTEGKLIGNSNGTGGKELKATCGREDRNFPCTHCGLKFSSNDRLTSHLLQCKSRKNPYESYQYKCIKCSESFDIYLHYKRHIAIHTGEIRYS